MKKLKILLFISIITMLLLSHFAYAIDVQTNIDMPYIYWYIDNSGEFHLSGIVPTHENYREGQFYDNINNKFNYWPKYFEVVGFIKIDTPIKLYGKPTIFSSFGSQRDDKDLRYINLEKIDTSNVTDISEMFRYASGKTIDISSLNLENVTNMSRMFESCVAEKIILPNTTSGKVTTMSRMFCCCHALKDVNIGAINTSNVTDMSYMFEQCDNLEVIKFGNNFNTANVRDMSCMFKLCHKLKKVDLSTFNTSNVTTMQGMFMLCDGLFNIDLSSLDTSNVTDMSSMFATCPFFKIDISNFNTSKVTTMSGMFRACKNLSSINLGTFDTTNLTDTRLMFEGCENLTSVDISKFNFSKLTTIDGMFDGSGFVLPDEYKKAAGHLTDSEKNDINEKLKKDLGITGPDNDVPLPSVFTGDYYTFGIKNIGQADQYLTWYNYLTLSEKAHKIDNTGNKWMFISLKKDFTDNSHYFLIEIGKISTKDYKLSVCYRENIGYLGETRKVDVPNYTRDSDGNIIISERENPDIYSLIITCLKQVGQVYFVFFDSALSNTTNFDFNKKESNDNYYEVDLGWRTDRWPQQFVNTYNYCFNEDLK